MDIADDLLAELLRTMGDGVIIADAEGRITFWNQGAELIFGWPEQEALGQTLDLIIPERLRDRHWEGYRKTMATGETRYGHDLLRVPAVNRAGDRMSIAFTVTLLGGDGGRPRGIAAVVRDETQRWADEQNLRRRLAELERAETTASS
jgi:PAS domain S-box-containing protein